MRGRPKLNDSRTHQYRIRLNDEEHNRLEYASSMTGKPKSEIFRIALTGYFNQVLMNETYSTQTCGDVWDLGGISLRRAIKCPHCDTTLLVDLEDGCLASYEERQMGPETLYEINFEDFCVNCSGKYQITGHISEYPVGALNYEDIRTEAID